MINQIQQREVFHIAFLRYLAGRLKPDQYAIKGGVGLRLFFGSPRFSEDMDIDIKGIETFKLKDIVLSILTIKTLQTSLRPFGIDQIIPPDMKAAKQTETTQRFKVHLINSAGEDIFTKIEFSKRQVAGPIKTETIGESILKNYKLPPLIVSHYPAETAFAQKINALANRAETQGRDIFDIYFLLPRIDEAKKALKNMPTTIIKKAYSNIFSIDFKIFQDTVLNYLNEEDRGIYNNKEAWEEIQLKVGEAISDILGK